MALARATVSGFLIGDPEKRFTQNNTAVTNFAIQVAQAGNRNDQPFVVRVTCWRNLADYAASLQKGAEVVVEGRLQVNQYEAAGGIVKRIYEIDASNIYLGHLQSITPLQSDQQAGGSAPQSQIPQQAQSQPQFQPQSQPAPAVAPLPYPVAAGGAAPVPQAPPANATWHGESFPQDTLLTEDDIPF